MKFDAPGDTRIDLSTSERILTTLDDEFTEECEYNECGEPRTHLLACPKCPATENMCEAHAAAAKKAPPRERVIFNFSCLHNVPMMSCGKIRISN